MSDAASIPHPLPVQLVDLIAQRFRVIGEPTRIRLLDALRERPMTIKELREVVGGSQQNVSKHIAVLAAVGIVGRSRQGTSVRCYIADESVLALCEVACGGFRRQVAEMDELLSGRSGDYPGRRGNGVGTKRK